MNIETRKAILLFVVLFVTWQVLYPLGLDNLLSYAIVLVVVAGFLALDKQSLAKVGLRRLSGWRSYIGIGCVLVAIICRVSVLARFRIVLERSGLVEETSFRGYILRNLRGSFSERKAVLYSAVLFALYHISFFYIYTTALPPSQSFTYWNSFILYTFVAGIFLGYFYLNTGQTIVGTLAFHSSSIFIQSFVPYPLAFFHRRSSP